MTTGGDKLPVLDYELLRTGGEAGRAAFAADLRLACTSSGFFYLDISGSLASESADAALAAARSFFSLPLAEKNRIDIANSPHFRGYAQVGRETTAHKLDLREQIDFGLEAQALPPSSAAVQESPYLRVLVGPNQWPDERAVPGFRPQLSSWFDTCGEVGDRLVEAFAGALGLPPQYFASNGYFTPLSEGEGEGEGGGDGGGAGRHCRMKISRYPPVSETGSEGLAAWDAGSLGVGPHKDGGFLSLLLQDSPGLQVQADDGTWIDAPPLPGTLVCNCGEMLELVSGGAFLATTHRVLAGGDGSSDTGRLSIPFFHNPRLDAVVRPAEGLPAELLAVAERRRAVSVGKLDGNRHNRIESSYGANILKVFIRAMPIVFETHHPDLLEAEQAAVAAAATVTAAASGAVAAAHAAATSRAVDADGRQARPRL